jgi:DNA-binding SARP family transcriptional activator/predicted ATPase
MGQTRVALLGFPVIERDGAVVTVDTRKAIALLAYLAIAAGPQSRDAVAALLWSEYDTASARGALRRTLSTLKAALGDEALESDRRMIRLRPDVMDIDVHRFQAALRHVRAHGHGIRERCPRCVPRLMEAVNVYRGDFLAGFALRDTPEFEDWQLLQMEALRRECAEALEGATASYAEMEQIEEAITHAQRWLALDPLHEPAHRALMQLYSRAGRRSAALRQYRDCVRILEEELAVPPMEETTRLYLAIKEHDEHAPVEAKPARASAELVPRSRLPLVGRAVEWDALLRAYDSSRHSGAIVALEGEAGIGKTRLLEELAAHARSDGAVVLSARCYEGEADLAYGPTIQLLRGAIDALRQAGILDSLPMRDLAEVARLLPEIDALPTTAASAPGSDDPGARTRFLDGLSRTLLAAGGNRHLLLTVDDLQWADAASLECLVYLVRRLQERHVGVLLTWRTEELPPMHVVRRVILDAQRAENATVLTLGRLDRASVLRLVEAVTPPTGVTQPAAELGDRLYEETEGLPLFLGEYLAALAHGPLDKTLPHGVRALLLSRLSLVGETNWQFLTAAAVIGRSFDVDTLRAISGRAEEMTVDALEELAAQGLVREVPARSGEAPTYDFRHDKLRELVYDRASLARRRLLHRRTAEALSTPARSRHGDAFAGQIAHHYQLAGMLPEAAQSFQRAGDHARSLYANREALGHYEAALALGYPDVAALHEAIGDLHTVLGEYRSAVTHFESAAALSDRRALARIEHKLGTVHHRWGEWELAESYFEEALAILGDDTPSDRARLLADWSMAAYHRGHGERAAQLARTALDRADEAGDPRALAQTHNMLGILEGSFGHRDSARAHLTRSLALADILADPAARVAALQNLAALSFEAGDLTEAQRLTGEALTLSITLGDRHREAALHNAMADLLHSTGAAEEAMEHLKAAVAVLADIGAEDGKYRPEVWKLSEW